MATTGKRSRTWASAVVCLAALVSLATGTARADPGCGTASLYVVAHEDDDMLFQSPSLLRDVRAVGEGRCVRTVYLTAGDAGKGPAYWEAREAGVEAAYAQMADVANDWTGSVHTVDGHPLHFQTLKNEPSVSVVFMRLPDGGVPGEGSSTYGFQSLMKLWDFGNPSSGRPQEETVTAVDGSTTYTYEGLIETLATLMDDFEPQQIAAQNFAEGFFQGDHPDHIATAKFTREAQKRYPRAHRVRAFEGYDVANDPADVSGELLAGKQSAFYLYGAHDEGACVSEATCAGTPYAGWLARQYVTASLTTGVVADAGYPQTSTPDATVDLDGSESSDESGEPLQYRWTQVDGPPVQLSGATTATPTFVAPSHPTLLVFSLVVTDGASSSEPSTVAVRLPSSDPTPTAVVGSPQTARSGATVELDGSESWDPESRPLQYEWTQLQGPPVALGGASTATPSFVAPTGPTSLEFSLVVSNGSESSAPAVATVAVKGIPPRFTSPESVTFTTGVEGSFEVEAAGSPPPSLHGFGALPPGVTLTEHGDGTATLAGVPDPSAAPPATSRAYPLSFRATNSEGEANQLVVLDAFNPGEAPAFTGREAAAFTTGVRGSARIRARGAPTPTLSLSGRLPAGLAFLDEGGGTATISGTPEPSAAPPASSVEFPVTVSAHNAVGTAERALAVTVSNPGVASSLPPPGTSYALVGRPLSIPVEGSGAPLPRISLRGSLPDGLTFEAPRLGKGTLTGIPRTAGTWPLTVDATNPVGGARGDLTLIVEPEPRLSASRLTVVATRRSRRVVRLLEWQGSGLLCTGHLPRGAQCKPGADALTLRTFTSLRRAGTYRLEIRIPVRAGTVTRTLTIVVRQPSGA